MPLWDTVQNLKSFWCGFLCTLLIWFLSEWKERGFWVCFLACYIFLPLDNCGMMIFYSTFLEITLEYASLLLLKNRNKPQTCFISNKVIFWQNYEYRNSYGWSLLRGKGGDSLSWHGCRRNLIKYRDPGPLQWMYRRGWRLGTGSISCFMFCQKRK